MAGVDPSTLPVDDELRAFPGDLAVVLVARGLVWATTYREGDETRHGSIIAADRSDAVRLAFMRGLSEVVEGRVLEMRTVERQG